MEWDGRVRWITLLRVQLREHWQVALGLAVAALAVLALLVQGVLRMVDGEASPGLHLRWMTLPRPARRGPR